MAEKSGKKKTKKAAEAEAGVLGNLSASRPTRLGGERRASTAKSSRPAASSAAKTAAATKPKAASSAAKSAAATKPKAAKPKAVKPKVRPTPRPPSAPPAGWQTPGEDGRTRGRPGGTEIVTTAVQAAGEIAQLGIAVGGQLLKRAAGRIPRP